MLLAIDVGNSTVAMGVIENGRLSDFDRFVTDSSEIEINYTDKINGLLSQTSISSEKLEGVVISSVVPLMTEVLKKDIYSALGKYPLVVSPKLKCGFQIGLSSPECLGSDRIADAAAGIDEYGAPLIIIDMGTATTISIIDKSKTFIGGLILPGVRTAMNSLINSTAQLPQIKLPKETVNIIGNDTVTAIQNGIVHGNAACIDGLLDRISEELGYAPRVVVTGGNMPAILPFCRREMTADRFLILKGLELIFQKNREAYENAQK